MRQNYAEWRGDDWDDDDEDGGDSNASGGFDGGGRMFDVDLDDEEVSCIKRTLLAACVHRSAAVSLNSMAQPCHCVASQQSLHRRQRQIVPGA